MPMDVIRRYSFSSKSTGVKRGKLPTVLCTYSKASGHPFRSLIRITRLSIGYRKKLVAWRPLSSTNYCMCWVAKSAVPTGNFRLERVRQRPSSANSGTISQWLTSKITKKVHLYSCTVLYTNASLPVVRQIIPS